MLVKRKRRSDQNEARSAEIADGPDYSVKELAEMLQLSESAIRAMFHDEPGVLKVSQKRLLRGRPYVTLRVPRSVLTRVTRKLG